MTATELLALFRRRVVNAVSPEGTAQALVSVADMRERESLERLAALYTLHARIYGRRRP